MDAKKLIADIRSGDDKKEQDAIAMIYEKCGDKIKYKHYRSFTGLTEDDFHDSFIDAIYKFRDRVLADGDIGVICIYIKTILRNSLIKNYNERKKRWAIFKTVKPENYDIVNESLSADRGVSREEQDKIVEEFKKTIGERCYNILYMRIIEKISMKEIANFFGYKSADVAKSKKNKCLNKARNIAKENPHLERTIKELLEE